MASNFSLDFHHVCDTMYHGQSNIHLTHVQSVTLIAINVLLLFSNLLTNSAVIYALIATKHTGKVSTRLILYLSISDCVVGGVVQPLFILILKKGNTCTFETYLAFISAFIQHLSAYIIILIGYDRFCRMKYLSRYNEVMKHWKHIGAIGLMITLSMVQALSHYFGTKNNFLFKVTSSGALIDSICFAILFYLYSRTVKSVQRRSTCSATIHGLKPADKVVTRIASRIMVAVTVCYVPYIPYAVIYFFMQNKTKEISKKQWIWFTMMITYELTLANSLANGVICLRVSKKYRKAVLSLFRAIAGNDASSFNCFKKRSKRSTQPETDLSSYPTFSGSKQDSSKP